MRFSLLPVVAAIPLTIASIAAATTPPFVTVVSRSVRKVCQLTGDFDRELQQPTLNLTATRDGVWGTDLGIPVEYNGQLFILFGDTVPTLIPSRGAGPDAIAVTDDVDPDDCVALTFLHAPDGWFARATIPGVSLADFEVPSGGFSANGKVYAFYTTDAFTGGKTMGRSVLASATAIGATSFVYSASTDRFINISPTVVENADIAGLPATEGQGVLLFGSGNYRVSSVSLAFVPTAAVEDRTAWRFFTGFEPGSDVPAWSANETDAQLLFDHPCVGELSVTWNPYLGQWLMLYNCDLPPYAIVMRTAEKPWGPWSPPASLFDPARDPGYCHFIHAAVNPPCDVVSDPGREDVFGGPYGPYVIPRFTSGLGRESTVYFTMSTWNPYETMLMRSTLQVEPDGQEMTGAVALVKRGTLFKFVAKGGVTLPDTAEGDPTKGGCGTHDLRHRESIAVDVVRPPRQRLGRARDTCGLQGLQVSRLGNDRRSVPLGSRQAERRQGPLHGVRGRARLASPERPEGPVGLGVRPGDVLRHLRRHRAEERARIVQGDERRAGELQLGHHTRGGVAPRGFQQCANHHARQLLQRGVVGERTALFWG
jgi:hypothetical protein